MPHPTLSTASSRGGPSPTELTREHSVTPMMMPTGTSTALSGVLPVTRRRAREAAAIVQLPRGEQHGREFGGRAVGAA